MHEFTPSKAEQILLKDANVVVISPAMAAIDAMQYFDAVREEVPWQQKHIVIFGKRVLQPRLVSWHGDPDARYYYSGVINEPLPWTATLNHLRTMVESLSGEVFNSVLCNLYRDGQDSMGWHSDDERDLGTQPTIASLSFGAPRRFLLQHKKNKAQRWEHWLGNGDLLLMRGTTQQYYRHSVPKTAKPTEPRINLTFRRIIAH